MDAITAPAPKLDQLADRIAADGVDAVEVARLRKEIFADGVADREEVEFLFRLNERAERGNDRAWYDFFVEALSDYFVWKQEPPGYLSDADADYLVERIARDGRIDSRTEFGLLVNIVHRLRKCPEKVIALALEGVRETVLEGGGVLFGPDRRRPGVIDRADVDVIRSVLFGSGGDGSLTISRREAELVFDLNDRTAARENAPEWRDLFVQAIANHLMFPSGTPAVPDRDEALRRERWLARRRGAGAFMTDMLHGLNGHIFAGAAAEVFGFGHKAEREAEEAAERARETEAFARESIDEAEAAWLIGRIRKDGVLHPNERALLLFIRDNATSIHPSLKPLIAEAERAR